MGNDDQRKRVERAVEGTREWVERAGGDVADRLGRAWDTVRRPSPSDAPMGRSPSPSTTKTLFSRDRRRGGRSRASEGRLADPEPVWVTTVMRSAVLT
jgi:hypothetical protein